MKSWGLRRKSSKASIGSSNGDEQTLAQQARSAATRGTTPRLPSKQSMSALRESQTNTPSPAAQVMSSNIMFPGTGKGKSSKDLHAAATTAVATVPPSSGLPISAESASTATNHTTNSRPSTPTRRAAPHLFRPRPSSVVSVASTEDALGDVSLHGADPRRSLDEQVEAHAVFSSSPKSATSAQRESALAHLASTQQRDERARLTSLHASRKAEGARRAARAEDTGTGSGQLEQDGATASLEAQSSNVSKAHDPSGAVSDATLEAGQSSTANESNESYDKSAHVEADQVQTQSAGEIIQQEQSNYAGNAHRVEKESIGDSMQTALEAMRHVRGAAHLDVHDGQDGASLQKTSLSYVPRKQSRSSSSTFTPPPYKPRRAPTNPPSLVRCELRLIRTRTSANISFSRAAAPPVGKSLSQGDRKAPFTSTGQSSSTSELSPLDYFAFSAPVPAIVRCNDVVAWATERAARLASCIVAVFGS